MAQRSRRAVSALVVGAIAAVMAGTLLAGELAAQRPDCCVGRSPVASIYAKEPNRVERLLLTGDGQVFAALAQDPSLSRPAVLGSSAEFSYRAQRPALSYAAWLVSLGDSDGVGAALLVLAVLGCAAAAAIGALLLQDRNTSPYWALGIVVAGLESLHELTPELAAFALFGGGLLLWTRDRRAAGVLLFVLAVATRETMLVGVLGVAAWELVERRGVPGRLSRVAPLAWPFAFYAGWALLLRLRTGAWPTAAAGHRTGLPGSGLLTALRTSPEIGIIVVGTGLAIALCVAAWVLARHDPLTWITTAFLVFAPTMAPVVWGTHAGFTRVLLPLYGFGLIAVASGLTARRSSSGTCAPCGLADADPGPMSPRLAAPGRTIVAVTLAGMLLATVAIFGFLASQETPAPGTMIPYASIYHDPLSPLDVALTGGDGHAFAVIAQDPTLSRPSVLREPAEFTYRAQRPTWGYLTWAASLGQSRFTGWTLVVLTILSAGAACAVVARLLAERGRSMWWALVVPLAGFETLTEMTPELFVLALLGGGVMLWSRERRLLAVIVLTVAVLTRETAMVAVVGLALWQLVNASGGLLTRARRVLPLMVPPVVYVAWIGFLRLRLGNWPFNNSGQRLSVPGGGFLHGLDVTRDPSAILFWAVVGVLLCVAALRYSPRDVLTWVALAYLAFATMLGTDVWVTNAGFQRALLPMYVFATVAALRFLDARAPVDVPEDAPLARTPA